MSDASTILLLGATGDIGGAVFRCAPAFGVRCVAAPRTLPASRDLPRLIDPVDAIVNCVGVSRPIANEPANRAKTFWVNVAFPAILTREAERRNKPVVHISTWVEDQSMPTPNALENFGQAESRRLCDELERVWQATEDEPLEPYLASKLMLEAVVARSEHSVAVRVSNVYGVALLKARLLPRLIQARLQGGTLSYADEARNYSTEEELGRFLLACATRRVALPLPVVHGLGSANTTVRELVRSVEMALPACYGQLIATGGTATAPQHEPSLRRYFPDLVTPVVALPEMVRLVVRQWRRRIAFGGDVVGDVHAASGSDERLSGGSIARKRVLRTAVGVPYVEKRSTVAGYEGAAAPKLAAEARFYAWLDSNASPHLRTLFASPVADNCATAGVGVATVYTAAGLTLADAIASFPIPRAAMRSTVADLYAHSYLAGLVTLERAESLFQLDVLYLDRAADRVHSFLRFATNTDEAPQAVVALAEAVLRREPLAIDGTCVENPLVVLDRLAHSSMTNRLAHAPSHVGRCGHGDLTILNMLWMSTAEGVRLIDPRGLIGRLDPIYDLGKLLFSLSGFALLMRGGLSWVTACDGVHRVVPSDERTFATCIREHAATLEWLETSKAFAPLRIDDWRFRRQLLLAEATHYLADVPYRYAQGRDWNRAVSVLLIGSKYLSRLNTS